MSPRPVQTSDRWLALGEASRFLGVDITTLRRWADAGQVRTFRTPGGHRRFAAADLSDFVRRRHSASARLADVIGPDGTALLSAAQSRRIRTQRWYRAVGASQVTSIGYSCRALMAALAAFLARSSPPSRRQGESAARALGAQVAALGLSAADATEAFLYFRRAIAGAVSGRLPLTPDRKLQSVRRIDAFFNRMQLVMMEAYSRGMGKRTPA
ncbi:MAG TPA: helix-turn-helix domain-containing protein [bacterium]|jgi:excisionase family DNA binding protein